jgi:hypothetical protein
VSALAISLVAFAFVFSGALLGMYATLPEGHAREDVKDVVRLSTGLIGTIAALVLGLPTLFFSTACSSTMVRTRALCALLCATLFPR